LIALFDTTTQSNICLPTKQLTKAAVLVGLFEHPDDQGIHVIMTVRSRRLRKHAGEVCFPVSPLYQSVRLSVSQSSNREWNGSNDGGIDGLSFSAGIGLIKMPHHIHNRAARDRKSVV